MSCNKQYQKSAIETYNSTTQTLTEDLTPLVLLGSQCTDNGCSISVDGSGVTINNTGLYYIGVDVTFTPTAGGVEIIQLYKDNVALPCSIAQDTVEADSIVMFHIETVLNVATCCAIHPTFTVQASGVAGGVNFVSVTAFKLA
jgi:hypothetical protein